MKALQLKVVLLAAVLGLSACKGEDKQRPEDKAVITASDKASAEELVASAEQLISPYSFMLAFKMADMAVKKDPTNLKAKFYATLLKRFEAFRGVAKRMRPLLNEEQLKDLDKNMAEFPESPLKEFLMAAGPEIKNEADVQLVIENYYSAIGEFRKFLKENENNEMTLNVNPYLLEQPVRKELAADYKVSEQNGEMTVKTEKRFQATKKLNIADMIVLRQFAATEMLSGLFLYSYDFSGIRSLKDKKFANSEESLNALFATPEFGKLRKNHGFSELLSIGSDLSVATAWFIKYQNELCPGGKSERPGYLFDRGLCISNASEANRLLGLLDSALKGAIEVKSANLNANTKVDYFAWGRKPIEDLRSIKPSYDSNGCAFSFADNTLGGMLPENNAGAVLLPCKK
jgi:hypothetical protein